MSGWLIETLVATTLLMLIVLMLREPVARRFGAAAAYALWLAPALRMILPPLPAGWFGGRDQVVVAVIDRVGAVPTGQLELATTGSVWDWSLVAILVWISGAAIFLGWHVLSYRRFADRARRSADWLFAENEIEVAASPAVTSPVAFGFLSKTVMLPADFGSRYDATEQRLALAHEVAHHRRHDLPANMAALSMLSLHWFNPIAHLAFRAFRLDQEAACDAQILKSASPQDRHAYGTALYKSATAATPLAACAMDAAATLKVRLSRIVARGDAPASRFGLFMAIVGTGGLVAMTASSAIDAAPIIGIAQPGPLRPVASPLSEGPREKGDRLKIRVAASTPNSGATRTTVRTAPVPPAPPSPPAMEVAAAVPPVAPPASLTAALETPLAPVAPVAAVPASHPGCAADARRQTLSSEVQTDGSVRREIRIIICNSSAKRERLTQEARERMSAALASTRAEIQKDQVLDAELRQRILSALDRHIASVRAEHQTTSGWSQPVPLQ